jgi:hypothetical protein
MRLLWIKGASGETIWICTNYQVMVLSMVSLTSEGQLDIIDVLIKLVTFLTFIVFAICVWIIKKEKEKKNGRR